MDVPVAVPVKRLVIDTRRGFAPDGPGDVDAMIRDLAARPSFDPRFGRWMLAQGKATAFLDVADTRFDDRRLAGAVVLKSITAQPGTPSDTLTLLRRLTDAADARGVTLFLDVEPFRTSWHDKAKAKADVARLYKRYGFMQPRANSKNFLGYDRMVREPRGGRWMFS